MSELPLVLITGAANGIGRATALELARNGVRMGLIDIDSAGLESLASELRSAGATFVTQAADVSRRWPLLQAVKEIDRRSGRSTCSWRARASARSPWFRTWRWTRCGGPSRSTCSAWPSRSRRSSPACSPGEGGTWSGSPAWRDIAASPG